VKPLIFISHVHESNTLASAIKEEISKLLLNGVDFFVSSDRSSIVGGDRWLNKIELALSKASIVLILCDQDSILRPWVNFEAGGAWISKKRVIPLCYGGLVPSNLPQPLGSLQAFSLAESDDLVDLIKLIADEASLRAPDFDAAKLVASLMSSLEREAIEETESPLPTTGMLHLPESVSVVIRSSETEFFDDVYDHEARDNVRKRLDKEKEKCLSQYGGILATRFGPENVKLEYSTLEFPGGRVRINSEVELLSMGQESSGWLETVITIESEDLQLLNVLKEKNILKWQKLQKTTFKFGGILNIGLLAQALHERGISLTEYSKSELVLDDRNYFDSRVAIRSIRDGTEIDLIGYEIAGRDIADVMAKVFDLFKLDRCFESKERKPDSENMG
jgi:hypothetical protein